MERDDELSSLETNWNLFQVQSCMWQIITSTKLKGRKQIFVRILNPSYAKVKSDFTKNLKICWKSSYSIIKQPEPQNIPVVIIH
jgi:hypothetical protein